MVTTHLPEHVHTFVIGAGFSGLGAAIKMDEAGLDDYLVVDKGSTVGGTWRDNTYPGAACDVPSQLYSFSFAPNRRWTRSYAAQAEIQAYLQRVAERAGVLDRFRFGVAVEDATWDDVAQRWQVVTSAGSLSADVLVSGAGALSTPRLPDIEGIEDFAGPVVHTAEWDHDLTYAGKRVAVIGTGASAIQAVPRLAQEVTHLDVYQRTAPWIVPRGDRPYSRLERLAFRHVPGFQRLYRLGIFLNHEAYAPAFTLKPDLARPAEEVCKAHLRRQISDPQLRRAVTPDFKIGCKRTLRSNDYYPALASEHVDLVTDGIERITATGVVTRTGEHREADVLVVATGFNTQDMPIAHHVKRSDGRTLADAWAEHGMGAYKSTTVADFPNLFLLVGPNAGLGHNSMIYMIESQVAYLVSALEHLRDTGAATLAPRNEVQDRWNASLQRRMKRTVWTTGGCSSWYLDEHGRNTTLWPRSVLTFRRDLRTFDPAAYVATHRTATTEENAA